MVTRGKRRELLRPAALVLVVAGCAAGAVALAEPWQVPGQYAGEYGLWVSLPGDSVVVQWLTPSAVPGALEARVEGRTIASRETPQAFTHRAAFVRPAADEIVLRYGTPESGAGGWHETRIELTDPVRAPAVVTGVDSLYVVGDTHGHMEALMEGLRAAGLIDPDGRWSGGGRHLAFAGDLLDRGPDAIALAWFVYRLEREAREAGGAVHVVLGNHEIMVMLGDLRYVHPKELNISDMYQEDFDRIFNVRESILGRWLASKPALIRVDEALVVHGGVGGRWGEYSLQELDDSLRSYMGEELFHRWTDMTYEVQIDSAAFARRIDFFHDEHSLFWHRDYVQSDTLGTELEGVLRRMDAEVLVVGHTPVQQIDARYGGRLITAHTPRWGAELLLLVRSPEGYERYRIKEAGAERF